MNDAGKNPKPQHAPERALSQEYAAWLAEESWDLFFTGTFRKDYSPDGARRACRRFFSGYPLLRLGLCFVESGSLYGRIHVHGVLRFDPTQPVPDESVRTRWEHTYGYTRVETPRSAAGVSGYVSKYVCKHAKDETYIVL